MLLARLTVRAGPPADLPALEASLAAASVTAGIDWALLARIGAALGDPTYTLKQVIAQGSAPEAGIDGEILMAVRVGTQAGEVRADGSVDYRDRHSLTMVHEGALLATIQPATRGRAGITVTGKELPALHGAEPSLAVGPGVERRGQELQANRDGVLSYVPLTRIDVVQHVEHQADVDYASGHLEVRGSIEVSGDVQSEFSVVASDDVIIKGSVSGGTVCAGNSIHIAGGAIGKGTELVAGMDLDCRHGLEATLRAGGTISFGDHSINCRLTADKVYAESGRGAIIGGEVQARTMISLCEAGSSGSVKTVLAVAIAAAEQSVLVRLRQDTERAERREHKRGRDRGQRNKGGKATRIGMQQKTKIADLQRKLAQEQQRLLAEARVQISGTAHTGVRIRFAEHELRVKEPLHAQVFLFDQESETVMMEAS